MNKLVQAVTLYCNLEGLYSKLGPNSRVYLSFID
jgi:hypothetical protein